MATTTRRLLRRVLDEPDLPAAVRSLPPASLATLIGAVGIEDAGELLAIATPEQFVHLIDESLWQQDGPDERFDHQRFVTWLEVMFEGGDALVVEKLRALPEDTLALALTGQVWVFDSETLGIGMAGASAHEAELAEKALDASLYLELDNYTLVSRQGLGWDSVIAALLALDRVDHELVERLLEQCCRASTEAVDDEGGLYEVLTAQETMTEDALDGRDQRRSVAGYVSAADAVAFLRLAEATDLDAGVPPRDAITAAYFRAFDGRAAAPVEPPAPSSLAPLLEELGGGTTRRRGLPTAQANRLRDAMAGLPADVRARRESELMYLANVLVAAGRGHSPVEAAQRAVQVCGDGLARLVAQGRDPRDTLHETTCDQLLRLGLAGTASSG
jgi:hypothetical protein